MSTVDDPISEFLRERNKIKFIVAETYAHCDYVRRTIIKRPRSDVYYISTSHPYTFSRLYGYTFKLDQIYIYETACQGRYYTEFIDELIWRIGG